MVRPAGDHLHVAEARDAESIEVIPSEMAIAKRAVHGVCTVAVNLGRQVMVDCAVAPHRRSNDGFRAVMPERGRNDRGGQDQFSHALCLAHPLLPRPE